MNLSVRRFDCVVPASSRNIVWGFYENLIHFLLMTSLSIYALSSSPLSLGWQQWLTSVRRDLHRIPELGFREERTAAYVRQQLDKLGIACVTGIGGTGIIATVGEARTGEPCVALRADMDALALEERTGLAFASEHPGIMHACGHDGHMAMLLGAASILRERLRAGSVKLLFQPAEETEGGAQALVGAGALAGVRFIFGGHIDPRLPTGRVAVQPGLICAYTDGFTITISGESGHAARPHECRDAIAAAAHLISALQTLVSREINPLLPAVVSVGKIRGGSAPNIIAGETTLEGTIRSTSPEVRAVLVAGLKRMAAATGHLFGIECCVALDEGFPPIVNDPEATAYARDAAVSVVGEENVCALPHPSMGGEDFSFYLLEVPGCFVRFGAAGNGRGQAPLHSPHFDFDEQVLEVGARFMAEAAMLALGQPRARGAEGGSGSIASCPGKADSASSTGISP